MKLTVRITVAVIVASGAAYVPAYAPAYADDGGIRSWLHSLWSPPAVEPFPSTSPKESFPAYETCQKGYNDYFEDEITQAREVQGKQDCANCEAQRSALDSLPEAKTWRDIATGFPMSCIWASMNGMTKVPVPPDPVVPHIFYSHCAAPDSKLTHLDASGNPLPRPCVSQKLVSFVYDAFMDAMSCVGLSPEEMFPEFPIEGNFQIGLGLYRTSRTHGIVYSADLGIAQLVPDGIRAINGNDAFKALRNSENCSPAAKRALSKPLAADAPCERIHLPENPLKSFLYAAILYKENKRFAASLVAQWEKMRSMPLNDADREALTRHLGRYMYNGGGGGIHAAFEAFLIELKEEHRMDLDLATFKAGFKSYLADHYGTGLEQYQGRPAVLASKRGVVSGYATWVEEIGPTFEKKWGIHCTN